MERVFFFSIIVPGLASNSYFEAPPYSLSASPLSHPTLYTTFKYLFRLSTFPVLPFPPLFLHSSSSSSFPLCIFKPEYTCDVISFQGRYLPLKTANVNHTGVYRCVADNNIKPPDEHLCSLEVFHAPTARVVQDSVGQAQGRRLSARLDCIVNGESEDEPSIANNVTNNSTRMVIGGYPRAQTNPPIKLFSFFFFLSHCRSSSRVTKFKTRQLVVMEASMAKNCKET